MSQLVWNNILETDKQLILSELQKLGCHAIEVLDAAFVKLPTQELFILRYVDEDGIKSITITPNM